MFKKLIRWSVIGLITLALCLVLKTNVFTAFVFMVAGYLIGTAGEK